jgi:hypothetical protein
MLFSTYALQPSRLIVRSGLDVPTFATRRLHACHHEKWDRRLYFPSEGRRAEDFFRPAECEPANLGTKGQHATSRPPKPLYEDDNEMYLQEMGLEDMDWIDLAQGRNMWRALVNMLVNFRVP